MPLDEKTREEIERRLQKQTGQGGEIDPSPLPSTTTQQGEHGETEHKQDTTNLESASTEGGEAGIGKADETHIASREPVNRSNGQHHRNEDGSWSASQPPSNLEPRIINGVYIPEKPEAQKRLWVERLEDLACKLIRETPSYQHAYLTINDVREPIRQEMLLVTSAEVGTAYYAFRKPDWIDDDTAWALMGNAVDVGFEVFRRHYRNELILQQSQNGTTPEVTKPNRPGLMLVKDYLKQYAERAARPIVVEELLYQGDFSALVGRAMAGKSTLACALLRTVALGGDFLGRKTIKLTCAYLALERNGAIVAKQFCKWGLEELIYFLDEVPVMDAPEFIKHEILRCNIKFLVLDHLQHATGIIKGNDYADVSNKLKPYQDIARQTGCGILGLHHQGKPQKLGKDEVLEQDDSIIDALGSEAYRAAFDTFMECSYRREQYFFRAQPRIGTDIPRTNIQIDLDTGEVEGSDAYMAEQKVGLNDIQQFLLQLGRPATEKEIKEKVEGEQRTLSDALRKGVSDGYILREGRGGKAHPFLYSILVPMDS